MKKTILLVLVVAIIIGLIPGIAKAKLVACVGNSQTYGYGLSRQDTYPDHLERILQQFDPQWEVRNFGVSGAGLLSKGNKPYVLEGAFHQALNCEPDVVIIELGANDAYSGPWAHKDDFIPDYSALIDSFTALPSQPLIWLCNVTWVVSIPSGIDKTLIRNEMNPLIQQVGTYKNVPVIDLYTSLEDKPHLFLSDGVHWNTEGAKLVAEIVATAIFSVRWPPDFNGDGIVDSTDMCIMVDHWHTDYPLCDIAPAPFGDGIVDVQDLIVLAEHLFTYPGAVAYWKLDETEGILAHDSSGENDAYLIGDPIWQPAGGMVDGAIQLDGVDDCAITGSIPNPTEGPFSVFAWVKGGAPGQAVLSQMGGARWLCADPTEGNLMTELKGAGRGAAELLSQTIITDGNWHRIGLVWDGSHRTLYVDDVAVAEDEQTNLEGSENGLYIGAGTSMEPGTFWSGLIDDVRIYNRAVTP